MRSNRAAIILAALASICAAQDFKTESFHGRKAFVLDNGRIRVSALAGGGHIAELRFSNGGERRTVNPMRIPHYQTIEPHEYNPSKHDALFGSDPHRWLHSGYMGHFLCFPAFGPPSSPGEIASGLGNHGEAPIVEWRQKGELERGKDGVRFHYGADLRKTHYRVDRTITMRAGEQILYVEEQIENQEAYDRPVNWVQHATFGPPFTMPGKTYLDMSATKGQFAGPKAQPFNWPTADKLDLRPFQPTPKSGLYYAALMDQKRPVSYFTMYNSELPVLIGYVFKTAESPWIGDFQENQRSMQKPWDGKTVTRGIEFGTTPFAEGLRRSVDRGSLFGVPTFRWISGREKAKSSYLIFLVDIPDGYGGVANITIEEGSIVIQERGSDRRITLPATNAKGLLQ